jgi:hypothetical protein
MKKVRRMQALLLIGVLISTPVLCRADMSLGLRKDFVNTFKDKATITTQFHVDAIPKKANPHPIGEGSDDGDIHIAGRDDVILLPVVAEIINARLEKDALTLLKQMITNGTLGQVVQTTGIWRIWFEHLSTSPQLQGADFPAPNSSGIAHAFELHPVTEFGEIECRDSFLPIVNKNTTPAKEFKAYDGTKAFGHYESLKAKIRATPTGITLTAGVGKLNYAEFIMELAGKPRGVGDGYIVPAKVYAVGAEDQPLVSKNRRMIFVKESPPADIVKDLVKGDTLRVLGIPRVNLNKVAAIAEKLKPNEEYEGPLPYEMIIVAAFPDE